MTRSPASGMPLGPLVQPAPAARRPPLSPLTAALIAGAAVLLVSMAGALFPPGAWYDGLAKPAFTPPNAVFGPVWGLMYTLNAVALYLLLRAPRGGRRRAALAAMAVQLALNALWTPVFFGAQMMGAAVVVIVALAVAIAATIALAWRVRGAAAALLVPYLGWVAFAAVLNASLWAMNR